MKARFDSDRRSHGIRSTCNGLSPEKRKRNRCGAAPFHGDDGYGPIARGFRGTSHLRPSTSILYSLDFACIATLGLRLVVKALTRHVVNAAFSAIGREVAFDRILGGTSTIFEWFHSRVVGIRRSVRGMRKR